MVEDPASSARQKVAARLLRIEKRILGGTSGCGASVHQGTDHWVVIRHLADTVTGFDTELSLSGMP